MEVSDLTCRFDACVEGSERVALLQSVQEDIKTAGRKLTDAEVCLLVEISGHEDSGVREACLVTLECWSAGLARIVALSQLLDVSVLVRTTAVEVLEFSGESRDRQAVERVLAFDDEWTVRASAVSCLASLAGTEAKPAMVRALNDENAHVRRYAADALARVGSAADVAVLQNAEASETEEAARIGIYSALYQLGDASYLSKLLDLIDTPAPEEENQILVLRTLNDYLFPGDFERVASYLRTLNLQTAPPAVRERAMQLAAKIENT